MSCTSASCCRRHPRACRCASHDRAPAAAVTAVATVASADAAPFTVWIEFVCRFARLGTTYVGSAANPCKWCPWQFVQLGEHHAPEAWGRYVVRGLGAVWARIREQVRPLRWVIFARVDMQWFAEPQLLLGSVVHGYRGASRHPIDTESYWGVNDRFAICSAAAAPAYFGRRALLLANTETLLAAALRESNVSVLWVPTLGALRCCASTLRECNSRVCRRLRVNDTSAEIKYIFEAQAAAQHSEVLRRRVSHLARCRHSVDSSADGMPVPCERLFFPIGVRTKSTRIRETRVGCTRPGARCRKFHQK